MKRKKLWLGILALVLVYGVTFISCDDGSNDSGKTDPALNGSWITDFGATTRYEIIFNNGNGETFVNDTPDLKWTYTTNNGSYASSITQLHGSHFGLESRWYSRAEFLSLSNSSIVMDMITDYTINGNTLTLINSYPDGTYISTATYTRK